MDGRLSPNEKRILQIERLSASLCDGYVPEEKEVPEGFVLSVGYSLADIAINRFDRPRASIKPTLETIERFECCEWPHVGWEENTQFIKKSIKFLLN